MPQPPTTEFAPAKINLTLHVTGQRDDGYHLLDSLVVFCDVGDWVEASPADQLSLTVIGPEAGLLCGTEDNLVLRAARAIAPSRGGALTLDKRLPVASGIGGGSADAAATLRALTRMWQLPMPEAEDVLRLGADVPVCLAGKPTRMRGIGELLEPVGTLPRVYIALVNPRVEVPTPTVFKTLATKQNPPMSDVLPDWPDPVAFADWLKQQRNDLEEPACKIAPVIRDVLTGLAAQRGVLVARMSGSGATCFGLFARKDEAKAAADTISRGQPGWWVASGAVL